jgi:pimeloyl-ACP methyl ester carboxylesterase/DNA-binding winged helix-turn-helix (wHTH) protein
VTAPATLTFGEFRLDAVSGHLYRGPMTVPLTPKAFALLQYLALQPGRLIPKEELLEAVWPNVFVGEAVLKGTIREVRKALGDDPHTARFIETAHRRGYRFIAPVDVADEAYAPLAEARLRATARWSATPSPPVQVIPTPRVSYAHSGSVNIAYQVVGTGPIDLVFVMGWVSHLEYFWNEPSFARFLTRLSSMARLILFDKRGTGLSDAVPVSQLPTLEQRLDDVRAVMEAVGSERAVLLGVSEGGPLCSLFAATYPERTEALVMIGSYARRLRDDDYPWGPTREEHDAFCRTLVEQWGGPVGIEVRGPSKASDPLFREWWASYLRMGASPGAAVALTRMNAAIDIRNVLPSVRVPTLVLHRTGDQCLKVEEGRYLASHIPGATFVELDGDDHLPFLGDQDAILNEIEDFVTRTHVREMAASMLASVLTIRSEAVEADVGHLRRVFEREVAWSRGRTLEAEGRHLVATFDGPGRAVHCGAAVVAIAGRSNIAASAGIHIGECDPSSRQGPIADISAALADRASPGQVYVSRTIVDLVPGSGLQFDERGLIDVPGLKRELPMLELASS